MSHATAKEAKPLASGATEEETGERGGWGWASVQVAEQPVCPCAPQAGICQERKLGGFSSG